MDNLSWTFNTNPVLYEKMRPGYPPELYEDIFKYKVIDASSNVMEIGIGAGQATPPILKTGCKLTAVEYGDNFVRLCRDKFSNFPNFTAVTSKFEDFPLSENTFDLIYSASAFHWIPESIGYSKVFSMLRSGGAFIRFANHPYRSKDSDELFQAVQRVYEEYMPGSHPSPECSEAEAEKRAAIALSYGFTDISYRLYHRIRRFSAADYTALLGTYSDHIAIEETTRGRFFAAIEKAINDYGGVISLYDTLDMQLSKKP